MLSHLRVASNIEIQKCKNSTSHQSDCTSHLSDFTSHQSAFSFLSTIHLSVYINSAARFYICIFGTVYIKCILFFLYCFLCILSLVLCFFELVSWSTANVSRFNRAAQSTFAPRPPLLTISQSLFCQFYILSRIIAFLVLQVNICSPPASASLVSANYLIPHEFGAGIGR